MKRTLLALLLVCAVLLAGCEKDEQTQTTAPATTPIVTTVPTEATEPPHTHTYTETVTPPTCIEKGYTTYTCACGDTYTGNEVAATGHSYETLVTEATCTEGGYTTYTCSVCQDTYTGDEVAATGHSYDAVVTESTCTEAGYTTHTCACGDTYTDSETEATGHSYSQSHVTAATCTSDGYTTYTCACGDSYTADYTDAKGHNYGDWTTVKEPTTEEAGRKERTCSRCGHVDAAEVEKLQEETKPETQQLRIVRNPGWTGYSTGHCRFIDSRTTWTSEVTAYVYDVQSIYVSWVNKDGEIEELYIEPEEGYGVYAVTYELHDDGTVTRHFDALPD